MGTWLALAWLCLLRLVNGSGFKELVVRVTSQEASGIMEQVSEENLAGQAATVLNEIALMSGRYLPFNVFSKLQQLPLGSTSSCQFAVFLEDDESFLRNITRPQLEKCSWIVKINAEASTKQEAESIVRFMVENHDLAAKLRLNSLLYFMVRDNYLLEAYMTTTLQVMTVIDYEQDCVLPMEVWERRRDFGGLELKVASAFIWPSIFEVKDSDLTYDDHLSTEIDNLTLAGSSASLLDDLMTGLNFTVRILRPTDGHTYGVYDPKTGNWTGVIGLVVSGQADFSINDVVLTLSRSEVIDLSIATTQFNIALFMKKQGQSVNWSTYFSVFNRRYLLAFACTSLGCGLILAAFHLKGKWHHRLSQGLSAVTLALWSLNPDLPSVILHRLSVRIMLLTICTYGVLNFYAYNAGLTSSLTVEIHEVPINTLNDIITNHQYQIRVLRGTVYESFFSDATTDTNPAAKILYDTTIKGNPEAYYNSYEEVEGLLEDDKNVVFIFSDLEGTFANYPCGISKGKGTYANANAGLAFPKNSPFIDAINHRLLHLKTRGHLGIMKARNRFFKPKAQCHFKVFNPFSYHNIVSAFLMLCLGVIVSCSCLIFECFLVTIY